MFYLKKYQEIPNKLTDLLPWAALIAPGVILNKDGSLQRTIKFRGPDLETATETQLTSITSQLNNALKRFGSGWIIYIEANRSTHPLSPTKSASFPDPISFLIDAELYEQCKQSNNIFESNHFLTLQFFPPTQANKAFTNIFFTKKKVFLNL